MSSGREDRVLCRGVSWPTMEPQRRREHEEVEVARYGLTALAAALLAAAAFGAGLFVAGDHSLHPSIYTADGYVGGDQASFQVGDAWYGFESTVSWTDRDGSFHEDGWPECLPKVQEVKGVRIAASVIWVDGIGTSRVLWVDCRG